MSKRVLWNARPETLLNVVLSSRAECGVEVLTLVADVTGHTVEYGDVVWMTSSTINTEMNPVHMHMIIARSRSRASDTGLHKNRFFHTNSCIPTLSFCNLPFPLSVPFFSLPNPQMAVSSLCELRNSSHSHAGSVTVWQPFVKLFAIIYGLTFCLFMSTLYDTSLGPTFFFQTYTIRQL